MDTVLRYFKQWPEKKHTFSVMAWNNGGEATVVASPHCTKLEVDKIIAEYMNTYDHVSCDVCNVTWTMQTRTNKGVYDTLASEFPQMEEQAKIIRL